MPTLNWIGRRAVESYHRRVPYHLLKETSALSDCVPGSGNLLVEGDNLLVMKALLPYYAGKIKCIYIDPPYNTGNESWIYNDNVNSPDIKEWLGKVVGSESDDLCRHDKWLCLMYPRLVLARKLLAQDGLLFVSIDDTELPSLRSMLDEIFPHPEAKNRLACFVWQTEGNFDNQAKVKNCHEYVLAYCRQFERFPAPPIIDPTIPRSSKLFRPEIRNTVVKNGPKNPVSTITLPAGFPASFLEGVIPARSNKWPHYDQDLAVRDHRLQSAAAAVSGWSSKEIVEEFIATGFQAVLDSKGQETTFELTAKGAIECVKRRNPQQSHVITVIRGVGTTQQASQQLADMGIKFDYPKPVGLIRYLISMVTDKSALVADFFAGSGTTAQAVLELNAADGGNRRFILVDNEPEICRDVIVKRLTAVCQGYRDRKGADVRALGGGWRFAELGDRMFDEMGRIASSVRYDALGRHVYFSETGEPLPTQAAVSGPLVGLWRNTAIYLLFNGALKDKSPYGGNVLTLRGLSQLPSHAGPKVIYGTACRIGADRLRRLNIVFKQLPYRLKVDES